MPISVTSARRLTANYLYTIIEMDKKQVRDDDGRATGETRYEATFSKAKTRSDLLDKTRLVKTCRDWTQLRTYWIGLD